MITVRRTSDAEPLQFAVRVETGGSETHHRVTMARATAAHLCPDGHTPEQCIEAAFAFLLDREPKESILHQFDVTVIARYFPEFERELPGYLPPAAS